MTYIQYIYIKHSVLKIHGSFCECYLLKINSIDLSDILNGGVYEITISRFLCGGKVTFFGL